MEPREFAKFFLVIIAVTLVLLGLGILGSHILLTQSWLYLLASWIIVTILALLVGFVYFDDVYLWLDQFKGSKEDEDYEEEEEYFEPYPEPQAPLERPKELDLPLLQDLAKRNPKKSWETGFIWEMPNG